MIELQWTSASPAEPVISAAGATGRSANPLRSLVSIRTAACRICKSTVKNIYHIPGQHGRLYGNVCRASTATLQASKKMDARIGSSCVVIGCGLGVVHALLAKLRGCAPVILVGDSSCASAAILKRWDRLYDQYQRGGRSDRGSEKGLRALAQTMQLKRSGITAHMNRRSPCRRGGSSVRRVRDGRFTMQLAPYAIFVLGEEGQWFVRRDWQ